MVAAENTGDGQQWDIRENALRILACLFSVQPDLRTPFSPILTNHKLKLATEVQTCPPDVRELYLKEI